MQRIVVVLDESGFTESILPSAVLLAGSEGSLILIELLSGSMHGEARRVAEDEVTTYLHDVAQRLRSRHVQVQVKAFPSRHLEQAVEEAVREFNATMVATATEARHRSHALAWGDAAWHLLAHSTVPILLRLGESAIEQAHSTGAHGRARIMVPLDGSARSELALPVAEQLAGQLSAPLVLVRVVEEHHREEAETHLDSISGRLHTPCEVHVQVGNAAEELERAALDLKITHIVMSSHGRTGLARVLLGSVAAELLNRLLVPIVMVPALSVHRAE